MPVSPTYALAHTFIPNLIKLKGAATLISALERKEKSFLDQLWQQAYVTHDPKFTAVLREPYRIGVFTLPPPKDLGEAHMVGMVVKKTDPSFTRYYTLEHDYVLAKRADRTLLCERDGQKHTKHGDGPVLTGDFAKDSVAFIDCFMEFWQPTRVVKKDTY